MCFSHWSGTALLRPDISRINIGRPIGIQRSYVPPMAAHIIVGSDARAAEMMGYGAPTLHDIRDDLLAEVMTRIWIFETTLHRESFAD